MQTNKQSVLKTALFFMTFTFLVKTLSASKVEKRVDEYLSDPKQNLTKLRFVLESGSMDGHFKSDELISLFSYILEKYPDYITRKQIGETFQKNPLYSFTLHSKRKEEEKIVKSKILFTGAHHARELLTATIVFKIFIESLHSIIHNTKDALFWKINDLLIVPLVNFDGHKFISDSFGTPDWDNHKLKRKNMNTLFCK